MNSSLEDIIGKGNSFVENKVLNTHGNILVEHEVEVVGNNFIVMDDIYISSDCSFVNVFFKGAMVFLQNNARVEFNNCRFEARNSLTSIVAQINGDIHLAFRQCEFIGFYTAVKVNNNAVDIIKDNCFKNCRVAFEIASDTYLYTNCTGNLMLSPKEYVFMNIKGHGTIEKSIIRTLQELTLKNNYGRIICYEGFVPVIDTLCCYASNPEILKSSLAQAEDGNIFFLCKGEFQGQYDIYKSIMLIGEDETIIIPTDEEEMKSAVYIEADYVTMKNIKISSSNTVRFRDGIRFSRKGGSGCLFFNIIIDNVRRRGISVWGNRTESTSISNCTFLNITEGCAVFAAGIMNMRECIVKNCRVAVNGKFSKEISISSCDFHWVDKLLLIKDSSLESINVTNNNYFRINDFLNTVE